MAELATAFVRLRPDTRTFKAEAESDVKSAGAALGKVFALAFGAVAVGELAKVTIQASAEQQSAIARIKQITKSAGAEWVVYGKTVKDVLIDNAEASGFDVIKLSQAFGRLQQQTKNTAETLKLLQTAEDISRARGMGLAQVATTLSRAYAGNVQGLGRLGIIIPKYTVLQDQLKQKLTDIALAEEAQRQSRAKVYDGTVKLTDAQTALAGKSAVQLAQLKAQIKAQEQSAAATDKAQGALKGLDEVSKRFQGQSSIFAAGSQGQMQRFLVAAEELEVSISQKLTPSLARASAEARVWLDDLKRSGIIEHVVESGASAIGQAVEALAAAMKAAYPAIHLVAEGLGAINGVIGAGPILVAIAAWKGLALATALVATTREKLIALGVIEQSSEAKQAATAAAAAEGNAGLSDAITEQTAVLERQFEALNIGTEAMARYTAATDAAAAANAELAGAEAAAVSPIALMLAPLALAAGAIYLIQQQATGAQSALHDLGTAFNDYNSTLKDGASAEYEAAQRASVTAAEAVDAAKNKLYADRTAGAGLEKLSQDQELVRSAIERSSSAMDAYVTASTKLDEHNQALAKSSKAVSDALEGVATVARTAQAIATGGPKAGFADDAQRAKGAAAGVKEYVTQLDAATAKLKNLSPGEKLQIEHLKEIALTTGKIPSEKVVKLTINDRGAYEALAKFNQAILAQTQAGNPFLQGIEAGLTKNIPGGVFKVKAAVVPDKPAADFWRDNGIVGPKADERKHELAKVVNDGLTAGAVQAGPSIQSQVADSLKQAVLDAKGSLASIGDGLGSQIGQVLDAQLATAERRLSNGPVADALKTINEQIKAEQAGRTARDSQLATDDAARKLADLQKAFGPGAHTAEQDAQLAAAQNAVLDAQSVQREAVLQKAADADQKSLDDRKANLEKANAAEKTAATRRIADLDDALNRGLISQKAYTARLSRILRSYGADYKSAGAALGSAFATGFKEQVASLLQQAKDIAKLTPGQRGTGSGQAPTVVDPLGVARKKELELRASQAKSQGTDAAGGQAKLVTAIKDLGAKVVKGGGQFHITWDPSLPEKDQANIRKFVKALQTGAG